MKTTSNRALPIPKVAAVWEHDDSEYPDAIRVSMTDGHVVTYRREVRQPFPQTIKDPDMIRIIKEHTYGGRKRK